MNPKIPTMKKTLLVLLVVLSTGLYGQTKFQKVMGTVSNDRNYHLAAGPDRTLYATGYTESVTGHLTDAFLVKYNQFGEVIWAKTYGDTGDETNWDLMVTQNGNIVGVGYSAGISTYEAGIITRTDSAGNVLWSRGIGSTLGNVNFYRVIETSGGDLLAAGLTSRYGQDDMVLCRFTSAGTLLWSHIYKSAQDDEVVGLIETPQGHFLLAGMTNDATGAGSSDFAVLKTTATGTVIWKKRYGGTGGDRLNSVMQIGNAYYFTGWTSTGGIGNYDAVVMKTDTAGSLLWIKGYGTLQAERAFNMLYDTLQNSLMIAGYTDYSDSTTNNRNTFLMQVDMSGTMNWARSYGGSGTDGHWPTGLAQNGDAGFYVLGCTNTSTFSPGNYSLYLIKTDPDGHTACNQKNPQFAQATITGWTGVPFGTDSVVTLISQNLTVTGVNWTLTTNPLCCQLYAHAGPAASVCPGDSVQIGTPPIPGYFYSWTYNGNLVGSQPMIFVPSAQAGNYSLTAVAPGAACMVGNSSVVVTQLPAPPKPVITYVTSPGNYLTSSASTGNQWYLNGVLLPGDTAQIFHAVQSGSYTVVVTNTEGCSTTSDPLQHTAIGIEEAGGASGFRLYPVPARGEIFLETGRDVEALKINLLNTAGTSMMEKTLTGIKAGSVTEIQLPELPAGVYFANLEGKVVRVVLY